MCTGPFISQTPTVRFIRFLPLNFKLSSTDVSKHRLKEIHDLDPHYTNCMTIKKQVSTTGAQFIHLALMFPK